MRRWITPLLLKWIVLTICVLSGLAGLGRYAHHQWRISELPGLCNVASQKQSWEELEQHAREWVSRSPGSNVAWFWLGRAQHGQELYNEAFESYEHVSLQGPRGIDAAVARLEIQFHVFHEPLDALKIAEEIQAVEPDNVEALRHQIYFDAMTMQRPQLAARIRQVAREGGDLPEHYLYLLNLEDLWFSDGPEVTERWWKNAPQSPLLEASHRVQTAKKVRSQWLTDPNAETEAAFRQQVLVIDKLDAKVAAFPQVLDFKLDTAQDSGDVEKMAELLSRVPDDLVDDPVFWRYRGWYAFRVGNPADADSSFREAIRLNPLSSRTRHEFAQFLRAQGHADEASQQESLGSQGTSLIEEVRKLPHTRNASGKLLSQIAEFARNSGDLESAGWIHKHQSPNIGPDFPKSSR